MRQTGFTRQHWQNLKDIGMFSSFPSYDDYKKARDAEDAKRYDEPIEVKPVKKTPKESGLKNKWKTMIVSKKDYSKHYSKIDAYKLVKEDKDQCEIGFYTTYKDPDKANDQIKVSEAKEETVVMGEVFPVVPDIEEETPEDEEYEKIAKERLRDMREKNEPIRLEDIPF
ncbi:MAG: hypothetical protein PHP37_04000 [Patescibacteria group bacterium]|jgi:hypothetical protein|nr:hypothetical protein [Patescibacteria group bacterium]